MELTQITNQSKQVTISLDILLDILKILLQNNIPHKILSINENEDSLQMHIEFNQSNELHSKAKENISSIIDDFDFYLNGPQANG